jgi:hypothetical protein
MKRYKSILKEDINTNATEFCKALETEIQKIFPKSFIQAKWDTNIYSSIWLIFTLGKDKSDYLHGYRENDVAYTTIQIGGKSRQGITKNGEIIEPMSLRLSQGGKFLIKPEDSFRAYSSIKVPFRSVTGTPEKIIDYLKKYFISFKRALQENREKLTDDYLKLIGDKF